MKKCELCLNSRPIVSENGIHSNCSLSPKGALNCMFGTINKFIPKANPIKVFVSVGMNGRDKSDIIADLSRASDNIYKYCKEYYNLNPDNIKIINNFKCKAPANASRLWYLGEAIKKLSECHVCYFVKGWIDHKGCIIEMSVCKTYGIEVIEEVN